VHTSDIDGDEDEDEDDDDDDDEEEEEEEEDDAIKKEQPLERAFADTHAEVAA
jgi:TATA-binding protein-associated factor Taf7